MCNKADRKQNQVIVQSNFLDIDTKRDDLFSASIEVTREATEFVNQLTAKRVDLLSKGGPWTFWAEWYARAMAGDPLPWDLQEQIALIPDDVWEAGPDAVAAAIKETEEDYWAAKLPQAEQLVAVEGGLFDVRPDPTPLDQTLENMLTQVEFAVQLPLQSNCGFNEMCTAYSYLDHTLKNCRNDPNAVEQHFQIAIKIIREKVSEGDYQLNGALDALLDGLERHALQIRGTFPEVRDAHARRVEQKIRETDDAMTKMVAGGMRAFQEEKTTGRLFDDTELDAQTVELDSGVEAKAAAIQRTGGRAAQVGVMERASQTAKDIDGSGGYKATRIVATGGTLVEMLKSIFGV